MGEQGLMDSTPRAMRGRLSRRALLTRAGALAVSTSALTALIACGGSSKAATQPTAMPTMVMPTSGTPTRTAASVAATDPNSPQVGIDNFNFAPKSLSVPVGTTVTWTNRDDVPHTVTSRDKKFSSQALDTDERFTFTFTAPGTYAYFCAIHPIMTAEIVVK